MDLADLKKKEQQLILDAVEFALASPPPSIREAYTDVLVEDPDLSVERGPAR
jgi:TPP-dependent pyruvate/acetoin dehydrogenase alpha subunit